MSASVPKTDEAKREVVVRSFQKAGLGKRIAEELEKGVLKVACPRGEPLSEGSDSYKAYKNQFKRICTHLRQNDTLARRLASGELPASGIALMDDEALMAEKHRNELEQLRQDNLQEALGISADDTAHWTHSDNYDCPRCESNRCVYIQSFKGFHSQDDNNQEPVITIRCTVCRHLWKEDEEGGGRLAAGSFVHEEPAKGPTSSCPSDSGRKPEAPAIWAGVEGREALNWLLPGQIEALNMSLPGQKHRVAPAT